jgi:hypothetical protein
MTATLHGAHCYDGETLVCGWPVFHTCSEPDCKRTVRPGWALCDDHIQKRIDRALGVTAPEPVGDMPRWSPAA